MKKRVHKKEQKKILRKNKIDKVDLYNINHLSHTILYSI